MEQEREKQKGFVATLVLIVGGGRIMLAIKKDKIGKGRYSSCGGKFELSDKSLEKSARRESWEEWRFRIKEKHFRKVAIAYFTNIKDDGASQICEVHIFKVKRRHCKGRLMATKEMGTPEWFKHLRLPENMMASDRFWLPEIFKGKKITVWATLKNNQSELVSIRIVEVDSFE